MKRLVVKFSTATKEIKEVAIQSHPKDENKPIDEEALFNLFTANIMKQKKKFIR